MYFVPFAVELFTVSFGATITAVSFISLETVAVAAGAALLTGTVISVAQKYDDRCLKDEVEEKEKERENINYAPDRPLPHNNGSHIPDIDAEHTQLGIRNGTNGRYRQAREFDKNGKPIRDIDFSDHGRPNMHPDPPSA